MWLGSLALTPHPAALGSARALLASRLAHVAGFAILAAWGGVSFLLALRLFRWQ